MSKAERLAIATVVVVVAVAMLLLSGCGGLKEHPHPVLEMQREERIAHGICKYPRRVAAAHGKDALETYVLTCE